ncbi:hypothetical protein DYB32_010103, partial [Aphanomyces invadans]
EETSKDRLLDDLVALFDDAMAKKTNREINDATDKAECVKCIREQAMQRGRRQSTSDSSDTVENAISSKRKLIVEAQENEIVLERKKLELKK